MRNRSSLAAALGEVRASHHLGVLFRLLGYRSDDFPTANGTTVVASWKGFRIVAADSSTPQVTVRHIARSLTNSSDRALAVAVSPSREMSLAAPLLGRQGITKVLTISLEHPSPFALQQLERLSPDGSSSALGHALYVIEVLSGEEISAHFFAGLRLTLQRMASSVAPQVSAADAQMLALLSLIRILFLYFVQAKGWLDGRYDFLRRLLDKSLAERRNFHRAALLPLFFGTLDRPPALREARSLQFGAIPYLNGGLFEPHEVEQRLGSTCFANELWRDAFDGLFEKYRFCVRESDEADAVAPDMLGRAFERLMDGTERQQTGTFYTPESVVRQIADATIETALTRRLPRHLARAVVQRKRLSATERNAARRELARLRILDPAVGSGAFLLGALESLADMHAVLEPNVRGRRVSELKRKIIRDNLMGVDLNPIAVRLAELRLWLAVIADDPVADVKQVRPLPNLDGIVRQGDTLLDPLGAARLFVSQASGTSSLAAHAVRSARRAIFDARGTTQRSGLRELRFQETKMAHLLLDEAEASTGRAIDDLEAAANSLDLFGRKAGLSISQRDRLAGLTSTRRTLQSARARLAAGQLPFFSFDVHAPDIMADGGFSVVIGNPPWVRAERLPPSQRRALRRRFSWWHSDGRRGYAHLPDLSVAFLQRCLELAAPGGAVGMLLPSKIVSAGYGEAARRAMVREVSISYLHRVGDKDANKFGATTYPMAVVLKKEPPKRGHKVRLGFATDRSISQSELNKPGPWLLLSSRSRSALQEFLKAGTALGRVAPPALGVKTGANAVFIGRLVETNLNQALVIFGGREVSLERTVLRPVLRGRDVRRYSATPDQVILWTHGVHGEPLESLPTNAARYLGSRSKELLSRTDYRSGAPWTVFRVAASLAKHRVVWADIARYPRVVALDETDVSDAIPLNTCYVAAAPDRECALAITATLNSTWSRVHTILSADEARGGYRRINARVASDIPMPYPGAHRKALAELSLHAHKHSNVSTEDLDEAVANALGLSARTRKLLRSLAPNNC